MIEKLCIASSLRILLVAAIALGNFTWASRCLGGLTACEVVVVVNGSSFNSRTLANHYIALRGIPPVNVIVLSDVPNSEVIGVEEFRTKILRPVLGEIDRRRLAAHVQCVTYSADFPTAIDISADLANLQSIPKIFTQRGSISGLTYLYAHVNNAIPLYIDLRANFYARRKIDEYFTNPAGDLTKEAWTKIQETIQAGDHPSATKLLEELFAEYPHQFPIAYLAAAEAALADNRPRAIALLQQAINAGWNAGGYLAKDKRFDGLRDDSEFQLLEFTLDESVTEYQPTLGFNAKTIWTPNGVPAGDPQLGVPFLLSTMLGVTRGNGTTLPEAVAAIQRSSSADFTHPAGTFYFSVTPDVRSTTRKWGFLSAMDSLKEMGFQAELIESVLPTAKTDVIGLQIGAPTFQWAASGSEFLPGAIADNLTSFGGVMTTGNGQSNLTEFLRAGAAGSSGTVTEPYAIQEKFPIPQLYVHYARGASLAEAFYMSVDGPYQLLIVGDPLCQPFSHAPQPKVDDALRRLDPGQPLQFGLDLSGPSYSDWLDQGQKPAAHSEPLAPQILTALLDGSNPNSLAARPNVSVHFGPNALGYHELIIRFASADPLNQRSQRTFPVWIGDPSAITLELAGAEPKENPSDGRLFSSVSLRQKTVTLTAQAAQSQRLTLWNHSEQIGSADGNQASFDVELSTLGSGPVRLQAEAELADGQVVQSLPCWIQIDP